MDFKILRPAMVALSVCLSGCGSSDVAPIAGGVQVEVDSSSAQRWSLSEEIRIGRVDGEGPDIFGKIVAIEVSTTGVMYILDEIAQEIRVFSPAGEFLRTIGRKGEGPGELSGGGGLTVGPLGGIWAWDVRNSRFTAFDSLGTPLTTIPRNPVGIVTPWRGGFGSDGLLYDFGIDFLGLGPLAPIFGRELRFTPFRLDPKTGHIEELTPFREKLNLTEDGIPRPLAGRLTFARDPTGYLWLAHTSEYRIHKTLFSGDTLLTIVGRSSRTPLDPTEIDSVLSVRWGHAGRRMERAELPASGRVLRRLLVSREGFAFVETNESPPSSGTRFDVFSPSGNLVAWLETGMVLDKAPRPIIMGDRIYAVVSGDYGEDYFVRARILKGGGSGGDSDK